MFSRTVISLTRKIQSFQFQPKIDNQKYFQVEAQVPDSFSETESDSYSKNAQESHAEITANTAEQTAQINSTFDINDEEPLYNQPPLQNPMESTFARELQGEYDEAANQILISKNVVAGQIPSSNDSFSSSSLGQGSKLELLKS